METILLTIVFTLIIIGLGIFLARQQNKPYEDYKDQRADRRYQESKKAKANAKYQNKVKQRKAAEKSWQYGSFEERLDKILDETERHYRTDGEDFLIDFFFEDIALHQIVKRRVLGRAYQDFGYVINIAFDNTSTISLNELERFKATAWSGDFQKEIINDAECYNLDVKADRERLIGLIKEILKEVYEVPFDSVRIDLNDI